MLAADFADWVASQTVGRENPQKYPVYLGPDVPSAISPKPYIVITSLPGGSITTEGLLEKFMFQVRVFGPLGVNAQSWNKNARETEKLARDVDRMLLQADRPVIADFQVIWIDRLGSGPYPQVREPTSHRNSMVCMYQVEVESDF